MLANDILTSEDLIEVAEPVVPFTMSDAYATVSPVLPRMVDAVESRMQPTVRIGGSFRRGAEAPTSASLAIFVVIGLVVGLCAFVVMTIALPENAPARTAMKPAVAAPAPPKPVVVPPVQVEAIKVAPQVITDAPAEPVTASVKAAASRHRVVVTAKRPSAKPVTLPSNPYKAP